MLHAGEKGQTLRNKKNTQQHKSCSEQVTDTLRALVTEPIHDVFLTVAVRRLAKPVLIRRTIVHIRVCPVILAFTEHMR